MKIITFFYFLLLFAIFPCASQNPDIEFKELNTWQEVPIYDDFGDRNGSYDVYYCDDITDTISLVYLYDYGDIIYMNSYYTVETGYGKKGALKLLSDSGWNIKIKKENNMIESFPLEISTDRATFKFDSNHPIFKLIKNKNHEILKFALYYNERLNSSFSIKSH